jgi:hypothetical protein
MRSVTPLLWVLCVLSNVPAVSVADAQTDPRIGGWKLNPELRGSKGMAL